MNARLYRSQTDTMIAGVAGGLGRYLGIDSTLVRLFFVLLAINGIGVFLYILLWILVPLEGREPGTLEQNVRTGSQEIADRARSMGDDLREMVRRPNPQAGLIVGAALILLGSLYLIRNLDLPWLQWLDFDVMWPLLLIIGGIALLLRRSRGE